MKTTTCENAQFVEVDGKRLLALDLVAREGDTELFRTPAKAAVPDSLATVEEALAFLRAQPFTNFS